MAITISKITSERTSDLMDVYKAVFSGHPWHEDETCSNALSSKCDQLYASECDLFDSTIDCRDNYSKRDNVTIKSGSLEDCVGCDSPLKTVPFYPDFINHEELISEAIDKGGFIGYLGTDGEDLVAFTWGYKAPTADTTSVAFTQVNPLLEEAGIDPSKAFYAAETGVVGSMQSKGYGKLMSAKRCLDAYEMGFETLITRTMNERVRNIFARFFKGEKGEIVFEDPAKPGASWLKWAFKDFDKEAAKKIITA